MELRTIWKVLRRRWWLVTVPALAALAYAAYGYVKAPPHGGFSTSMRFTAGSACDAGSTGDYQDCQYYPWLTSEYVVNALTDWVKTGNFAEQVSMDLKTKGIDVPPGQIQGGIISDNQRSVMTVSISGGDATQLAAIAASVIDVLKTHNNVFPQVGPQGVTVTQLDEPVVSPVPPALSDRYNPLVRFLLGLAAGVALAFLVDYIDPTLHERAEVEALGLPVLAEVPRR